MNDILVIYNIKLFICFNLMIFFLYYKNFIIENSKYLLTGSSDDNVILWDVETGKILSKLTMDTAIKRVEFSFNDDKILVLSERRMGFHGGVRVLEFDLDNPKRIN